MKIAICLLLAGSAAALVQAAQWKKVFDIADARKRKRYCQRRHYVLSALFIIASALLGWIASPIQNDLLAYAFASAIGFAPWQTVKTLTRGVTLGKETRDDDAAPVRDFIQL